MARAFQRFAQTTTGPTLIIVDSQIGYGAPTKQGTSAAHGEPLGAEEIRLAKRNYGWPEEAVFLIPEEVRCESQTRTEPTPRTFAESLS